MIGFRFETLSDNLGQPLGWALDGIRMLCCKAISAKQLLLVRLIKIHSLRPAHEMLVQIGCHFYVGSASPTYNQQISEEKLLPFSEILNWSETLGGMVHPWVIRVIGS